MVRFPKLDLNHRMPEPWLAWQVLLPMLAIMAAPRLLVGLAIAAWPGGDVGNIRQTAAHGRIRGTRQGELA